MKHIGIILLSAALALSACTRENVVSKSADIPAPQYAVFSEGLIADITPHAWLEETLRRQKEGLTGHPEAMDYPYNSPLWAGELKRDSDSRGADWWRFEQTAYYLDGLTRLGYITDDEELLNVWNNNLEYVLSHPLPFKKGETYTEKEIAEMNDFVAQITADPKVDDYKKYRALRNRQMMEIRAEDRPEGRLGSETESMAWPFAVFFRAMKACYEATGDPRIPAALEKNYLSYSVKELCLSRFIVNIEGMLWTWAITGNDELLRRAEYIWQNASAELNPANCMDDKPFNMHGVTMNEMLKLPMILYAYTGKEEYLQQALNADRKMEEANMLVDGVNSSTEGLAGNGFLASHETCDITDYTWTMGYFLSTTGDVQWADRIERCMFNAAFGCITKDFKAMQYFSCPNQFISTGTSDHNAFKYGKTWMQYRPIHETECCIGNLHRYFPNYVSRMWMKDRKGHPVATLYGPSEVVYDLGDGLTVKIEEITDYPFDERIKFNFTFYRNGRISHRKHQMDFTYRIPKWCTLHKPGFRTESREWKSGDVFTVVLTTDAVMKKGPSGGYSLNWGPLLFALNIPAEAVEDTAVYDNLAGKKSANPDFKSWSLTPAGKWNYLLVSHDIKVIKTNVGGYPFDPESVPVKLRVKVCEIDGWTLKEDRFTSEIPSNFDIVPGSLTTIDLVPYGSTLLRLSSFPARFNPAWERHRDRRPR